MKQKYQINCITGKYKLWIEEGKISDCNLKIQGEKILVIIIITGKYKLDEGKWDIIIINM